MSLPFSSLPPPRRSAVLWGRADRVSAVIWCVGARVQRGSAGRSSGGERVERRPRQDAERPALARAGSDAVVEADGRRVPVEHGPFHPVTAFGQGTAGELAEDAAPEPRAAVRRLHEDILDI